MTGRPRRRRRARVALALRGLALGLVLGWTPAPASMEAGLEAYQRGDFDEAFAYFQFHAQEGLPRAQAILGLMYSNGEGVERDPEAAYEWTERAALQGFPVAQYHLGEMYALGFGVDRDPALAVDWYRRAADQGHALSRERLTELGHDPDAPRPQTARRGLLVSPPITDRAPPAGTPGEAATDTAPGADLTRAFDAAVDSLAPAEPPTESTIEAPAGTSATGRRYMVQFGSFRTPQRAGVSLEQLRTRHEARLAGHPSAVERSDLGAEKGVWHRVRAGPFAERSAAREFCQSVMNAEPARRCFDVVVGVD